MSDFQVDWRLSSTFLRLVSPVRCIENKLEIFAPRKLIRIVSDHSDVMHRCLCDFSGFEATNEIVDRYLDALAVEEVRNLIEELVVERALLPSHEQFMAAHHASMNPQTFTSQLSRKEVQKLGNTSYAPEIKPNGQFDMTLTTLQRRYSCRAFNDLDASSFDFVRSLVETVLSSSSHIVPSAGNLRSVWATLIRRTAIGREIWEFDRKLDRFSLRWTLDDDVVNEALKYALDSADIAFGAECIAIFGSDLHLVASKYGNRGYRYAILETGQTVQSVIVGATEHGLATLEWGAFRDDALKKLIAVASDPLICLFLGRADLTRPNSAESLRKLYEKLAMWQEEHVATVRVSGRKEPAICGINLELAFVQCEFRREQAGQISIPESESLSTGIARTTHESVVRAIAEAIERTSSAQINWDMECKLKELPKNRDNIDIRSLNSAEQLTILNTYTRFEEFSESVRYQWKAGYSQLGRSLYLPVEFVYYPIHPRQVGRAICGMASSNGVAAGLNLKECQRAAAAELVERDAFVRAWRAQRAPSRWVGPGWFQKVRDGWNKVGIDAVALIFDGVIPTVGVAIISGRYPALCFGMASKPSWAQALQKAYEEACGGLLSAEVHGKKSDFQKTSEPLLSPIDHARHYWDPDNFQNVQWFFEGPSCVPETVNNYGFDRVLQETYFFDLTSTDSPLMCVRAVNIEMSQIWFGSVDGSVPHFFP